MSTTGAMVWIKEALEPGDPLEVVMQSEYDPKPVHMHMHMHVKRIVPGQRRGFTGYGCVLEAHEPWEKL